MIHDNYNLSEQEIQLFHSFGILVRMNLFTPEEMAKINDEFDRRSCTFNFMQNPRTPEEKIGVQSMVEGTAHRRQGQGTYHPAWLENLDNSQRRGRWISKLDGLGFIDRYNNN